MKLHTLMISCGLALGASPLHAEPPKPGLTLPAGRLNLALNLELDGSTGRVGKPTSIAPDASYGITDDLTVSLTHSTFMLTGFRGAAGKGLCLTGTDDGCPRAYNNVGAEGLYSVLRGPFAIALNAGIHATNLDAGFYVGKLGAKLRHASGALSIASSPSVLIALSERDGMPKNKDALFVPVVVTYKVLPALGLGLGSGIKGPIDGFADAWEVSLGVIGTYAVSPQLGVGASWVFGKAIGGADDLPDPEPPATGFRYRAIQLWASVTL